MPSKASYIYSFGLKPKKTLIYVAMKYIVHSNEESIKAIEKKKIAAYNNEIKV